MKRNENERKLDLMGRNKWMMVLLMILIIPAFSIYVHGSETGDVEGNGEINEKIIPSSTDESVIEKEEEKMSSDGFSVKEKKMIKESAKKYSFEAEVDSVMRIIIQNIYSDSEVFLRELISNGSDALDKLRFRRLTDDSQMEGNEEMEIRISADEDSHQLVITDTGVGMTADDLVRNLGTIAKSGTGDFLKALKEGKGDSSNLIGQFGVGFYSVFLVADEVTVVSKHKDDVQYVWQSDAKGSFTVSKDPRGNTLGRGTQISLLLKEEAWDFAKAETLEKLVKRYSEFITFPIYLWKSEEVEVEEPLTEEELAEEEGDEEEDDEESIDLSTDEEIEAEEEVEKEEAVKTKTVKKDVWDWFLMNSVKPIWTRSPKEITDDEYNEFYRQFAKKPDEEDPLMKIHFLAEGEVEFKSLLYIPSKMPSTVFNPDATMNNIKLYVKRVFITDDFRDILPKYLGFICGILDSDDLPLNLSREMLQQHRILKSIKKKLVRKAIAMFQMLAEGEGKEDRERYQKFWDLYGNNVKLGLIEDYLNRQRLSKLIMFRSSKTDDYTTLTDYVSRMKSDQQKIYYLAGDNLQNLQSSPLVEMLVKKGYEVIFGVDPIDEYAFQSLEKFDGKYPLINVAKDGSTSDILQQPKEDRQEMEEEFAPLISFLRNKHSEHISRVKLSYLLAESPCALVGTHLSANQERILRAQAMNDPNAPQSMVGPKKVMEVNPIHPLVIALNDKIKESESAEEDPVTDEISSLMFDVASLQSGFPVADLPSFSKRILRVMNMGIGLDPDAMPDPTLFEFEEEEVIDDEPIEDEVDSDEDFLKDEL